MTPNAAFSDNEVSDTNFCKSEDFTTEEEVPLVNYVKCEYHIQTKHEDAFKQSAEAQNKARPLLARYNNFSSGAYLSHCEMSTDEATVEHKGHYLM